MHSAKTGPASIQHLLDAGSEILSALSIRSSRILHLQRILRSEIGPPIAAHLTVANYSDHSLTLHTDSPAWASRLRFNIPNILDVARTEPGLGNLQSIRIKVAVPDHGAAPPVRNLVLSDATRKLLLDTAASARDEGLRTSLLRLADRQPR